MSGRGSRVAPTFNRQVCTHPESIALIKGSDVTPVLRKLAKVHGLDKGVVPPAEAQQAATILRAIEKQDSANNPSG